MRDFLFATGNDVKFKSAAEVCEQFGITLKQLSLDIPEIQAADGETVARDKALRVFEEVQKPVIISDDTWIIPGLNGFPGPYMKFMNHWFTTEDWLRLTSDLTDRRVILRQVIVYQDAHKQQVFSTDIEGILLKEAHSGHGFPHNAIVSLDGGKNSIAENLTAGRSSLARTKNRTSWHDLCEWLTAQPS